MPIIQKTTSPFLIKEIGFREISEIEQTDDCIKFKQKQKIHISNTLI